MNNHLPSSIRLYRCLLMFLFILLLTGCAPIRPGSTPDPTSSGTLPPAEADELAGSSWQLLTIAVSGNSTAVVSGSSVTLEFSAVGQATGNAGCNSYGGRYSAANDSITFSDMISTMMACSDSNVMAQEQQYLQALSAAERFELMGDQLTIWYDNASSQLIFTASSAATPVPTLGQPTATAATSPTALPTLVPTPTADSGDDPTDAAVNGGYAIGAQFTLPATGDYVVTLQQGDHTPSTNYSVTFTIE